MKSSSPLKQGLVTLASTLYCFVTIHSWADDTDIYLHNPNLDSSVKPNVLFVLDNSGSMEWDIKGRRNSRDPSRMEIMQDSFQDIMQNSSGLNVGLMKLWARDGENSQLTFPVTDIDKPLGSSSIIIDGQPEIVHSTDDGYETSSGYVTLSSGTLPLGGSKEPVGAVNSSGSLVTQSFPITRNIDNAVKVNENGGNRNKAAVLNLTYIDPNGDDDYLTGLRFQTLGVPQGATITSASLEFTASASNDSEASLDIYAGRPGSTHNDPFTDSRIDLSRRSKIGPVKWQPEAWVQGTSETPNVYSANVTTLVQQMVSDSSWCGNNAATFYIKSTTGNQGIRHAYSIDGSRALKPRLNIEYTGGESGCRTELINTRIQRSPDDAYQSRNRYVYNYTDGLWVDGNNSNVLTGLHYPKLPIKQGAKILEARLELTAYQTRNGSAEFRIRAHDADTSPAILPKYRNLSNRKKTSNLKDWKLPDWDRNVTYQSPDIRKVIQEVIDRNDWQAGNNLTLLLNSLSGFREITSYDENPTLSPRLFIKVASGGIDADSSYKIKDHLIALVDKMYPGGGTPLTPTYYKAAKYLKNGMADTPSPINNVCQANHVVLLTDGEANSNTYSAKNGIGSLTGKRNCRSDSYRDGEKCSRTLADWLYSTDLLNGMEGQQNVITHTIAFALENDTTVKNFLTDVATKGGGHFYPADDAAELAKAFNNIITGIIEDESSFVSPGVTANQFNNSRHLSQVYYSIFKPSKTDRWQGNLKRYQIITDPTTPNDPDAPAGLYDNASPPKPAIDQSIGFFTENAFSFWSDSVDGRQVDAGGSGDNLPQAQDRKLFTYLDTNPAGNAIDLDQPAHRLSADNSLVTLAHLGLSKAESNRRKILLDWIRDPTTWYGDPLHSIPALVTYGCSVKKQYCPEDKQQLSVLFGTNDGFLHSLDATSGTEQYAFMPAELLRNLDKLHANEATDRVNGARPYGMDGSATLWVNDINVNGLIYGGVDTLDYDDDGQTDDFLDSSEANLGEFVYAYIGLRRGGRSYYALDVTNPQSPKLLWFINSQTRGFENLGQTWSKPVRTRVKLGNIEKNVIIFSGGYDPDQDDAKWHRKDTMGNAIYMVDAKTGTLIWSAGNENSEATLKLDNMDYSIPGGVRIIDLEGDGLADQMLFADVGGQIWRLYVNNCTEKDTTTCAVPNNSSVSNLVWPTDSDGNGKWSKDEGIFAYLGPDTGNTDEMDNGINQQKQSRRFYVEPDVVLFRLNGSIHLAVSIGTGNRPDPLSRVNEYVQDRAYVMASTSYINPGVTKGNKSDRKVPTHTLIKHDSQQKQLVDITSNLKATTEEIFGETIEDDRKGWYINMDYQEKVMTESVTFEGVVYFNTYLPSDEVSASCNPVAGKARAYAVNLLTGKPVKNDPTAPENRYKALANSGLPPTTSILFPEGSKDALICVGAECDPLEIGDDKQTTYWRQVR